jgi:pimeloyl-ACP methyl ester carboxylesterase
MAQALSGVTFGVDGGIPLILLHAFPLDGRMWELQQEDLSRGRRVLIPDLIGFGRSPLPKGPHSIEDHALDVAQFLDAHAAPKALVCGLSMGGYVALAFASLFPYRVAGLVLADTRAVSDPGAAREARTAAMQRVLIEGMVFLADDLLFKLLSEETLRSDPELSRKVWTLMVNQRREGVWAALQAMRDRPSRLEELPNLTCPTLVLVGGEDTVTPPEEAAKLADCIPGARFQKIPGAGHLSNLEKPQMFNRLVNEFAESLPTP